MEYKITNKTQKRSLNGLLVFTLLSIFGVCILGFSNEFNCNLFVCFSVFYAVNASLTLVLHYQYFTINRQTTVSVVDNIKQLSVETNGLLRVINFSDIKRIDIYMLPSVYRKSNFHMLPFERYHYAVIQSQSQTVIITSLMVNDIDSVVNGFGIKIVKHKTIYPYIKALL